MREFWSTPHWQKDDVHLSDLAAAPFQRALPELDLSGGLFVIRGPRQIGKSSWLKLELARRVQQHGPESCYFASCENVRDHLDLADLLGACENRKYIFLDEVTFVKDWSRAIKLFMDTHKGRNMVLTGSNAIDLRRGSDRMPGRHRSGGEFSLLPMDFDEFISARTSAGWISKRTFSRQAELENFFRVGGFPAAVIEGGPSAVEPKRAKKIYSKWLVGDALKFGRNESYFCEVATQILATSQSPLSLQRLAQRTQLGSHHTALDYVQILEDSFALTQLYALDPNTGAKRFRKDKKFYFRDPLIYAIARDWSGEKIANSKWNEIMAEAMACEFLIRRFPRFGYFHSPKGEIDFYAHKKWALEVKWSDKPQNLSRVFKDMHIPWKRTWQPANFLVDLPPE